MTFAAPGASLPAPEGPAKEIPTVSVSVTLWLFGKPGHELNEGEEVQADQIRALAQGMKERLELAADIVEKLTGAGWEAQMGLYDVMLYNPYVRTEADVRTRLDDLGIDPDEVSILEFEGDEDDEDFDELEGEEEGFTGEGEESPEA
jgi:hypothetical protein